MSLSNKLENLIKDKGYLSYGDMVTFVVEEGYKTSYAERELRHLTESPDSPIKKEYKISKRGTKYVSGYYLDTKYTPPQQPKLKVVEINGELKAIYE